MYISLLNAVTNGIVKRSCGTDHNKRRSRWNSRQACGTRGTPTRCSRRTTANCGAIFCDPGHRHGHVCRNARRSEYELSSNTPLVHFILQSACILKNLRRYIMAKEPTPPPTKSRSMNDGVSPKPTTAIKPPPPPPPPPKKQG